MLQKASQDYQIRCILRRNTAVIFENFFTYAFFYRLSHSLLAITCRNRIWPDLAFHFDDMRYGYEITVDEHVMIYTYRIFIWSFLLINNWWYILVATNTVPSMNTWWYIHGATLYQLSWWWIRYNRELEQQNFWATDVNRK